jgi:iron complex transport system ATP-binding protein
VSTLGFHGVETALLKSISFEVAPGQLWALLGPNGAGKSTLLKVALGALSLTGGQVTLDGIDCTTLTRRERAKTVAWVPQTPAEDVGFTALELVLMGRAPHLGTLGLPSRGDVQRGLQVLGEVGLSGLTDRHLDEMSGGERRLCYLARARMQDAKVLLFDEPTAFLDVRHQVECLRALDALVRQGVAALAVLHDVNLAAQWATHAALLKSGGLLTAGRVGEVLKAEALSVLYGVALEVTAGGMFTAGGRT